jgi:hypothetical protein
MLAWENRSVDPWLWTATGVVVAARLRYPGFMRGSARDRDDAL